LTLSRTASKLAKPPTNTYHSTLRTPSFILRVWRHAFGMIGNKDIVCLIWLFPEKFCKRLSSSRTCLELQV
jgi:hypothetical protein